MNVLDLKVAYDSRDITNGAYFVPIIGERVDGHDYIQIAIENGAAGVIEEDDLYDYAKDKLEIVNPKIIAITGSVGKTSLSHYLSELISLKYNVVRTSHNRKIGIANDILNCLEPETEVFICESSVGHEQSVLTRIGELLQPDITILLNITEDNNHITYFTDIEDVVKNKINLLNSTKKSGYRYINREDLIINRYLNKYINNDGNIIFFPNAVYQNFKSNIETRELLKSLSLAYQIAVEQFGIDNDMLVEKLKHIAPLPGC